MICFALFTAGYFCGVITFLVVFPPRVKEIEEQENNALTPSKSQEILSSPETNLGYPVATI